MSFPILLQKNISNPNVVSKDITTIISVTGTLREQTSIVNPVIIVDSVLTESIVASINYAYIEAFKRYYYITDIKSIGYRLWQIDMHVDVLMSYGAQIRQQAGIVERQQYVWNVFLDDGSFPAYQQVQVQKKLFTNETPFENQSFVLIVAGPGGGASQSRDAVEVEPEETEESGE